MKLLEKESIEWIEEENSGSILIRVDTIDRKRLSFVKRMQWEQMGNKKIDRTQTKKEYKLGTTREDLYYVFLNPNPQLQASVLA